MIPQPATEDDVIRIESLLSKVTTSMKLQLMCLNAQCAVDNVSQEADEDRVTTV